MTDTGKAGDEPFEKVLARLEEIVDKMESGGLGLEESLALYEEGIAKSEKLGGMLNEARERVMKLVRDGEGKPVLEPLDGEEDAGDSD